MNADVARRARELPNDVVAELQRTVEVCKTTQDQYGEFPPFAIAMLRAAKSAAEVLGHHADAWKSYVEQ